MKQFGIYDGRDEEIKKLKKEVHKLTNEKQMLISSNRYLINICEKLLEKLK